MGYIGDLSAVGTNYVVMMVRFYFVVGLAILKAHLFQYAALFKGLNIAIQGRAV
jgi:hypothetical protein